MIGFFSFWSNSIYQEKINLWVMLETKVFATFFITWILPLFQLSFSLFYFYYYQIYIYIYISKSWNVVFIVFNFNFFNNGKYINILALQNHLRWRILGVADYWGTLVEIVCVKLWFTTILYCLLFHTKFNCNNIQSFVPYILCGILL